MSPEMDVVDVSCHEDCQRCILGCLTADRDYELEDTDETPSLP